MTRNWENLRAAGAEIAAHGWTVNGLRGAVADAARGFEVPASEEEEAVRIFLDSLDAALDDLAPASNMTEAAE
jgi:hypothetical protein